VVVIRHRRRRCRVSTDATDGWAADYNVCDKAEMFVLLEYVTSGITTEVNDAVSARLLLPGPDNDTCDTRLDTTHWHSPFWDLPPTPIYCH
jgi:hypothetical protein